MAITSSPSTSHQQSSQYKCTYRNRPCFNPRTYKQNGELHKLCCGHREAARKYQRDLVMRRREQEKINRQYEDMLNMITSDLEPLDMPTIMNIPNETPIISNLDPLPLNHMQNGSFSDMELNILQQLLE